MITTREKAGRHHLSQVVKVNTTVIRHIDIMWALK